MTITRVTEPARASELANQRIKLTSNKNELSDLRRFCRDILLSFWSSSISSGQRNEDERDDFISTFLLAANETVANVSQHQYNGEVGRTIECVLIILANEVQLDVVHDGNGFDPPESPSELDLPREHGMGLFLMEQCVDEIAYENTSDGRRRVRLKKRF